MDDDTGMEIFKCAEELLEDVAMLDIEKDICTINCVDLLHLSWHL
jgi:hypothetical protein